MNLHPRGYRKPRPSVGAGSSRGVPDGGLYLGIMFMKCTCELLLVRPLLIICYHIGGACVHMATAFDTRVNVMLYMCMHAYYISCITKYIKLICMCVYVKQVRIYVYLYRTT